MSYLYLASPYTDDDPLIRSTRYWTALDALHWLLGNKIWAYSPIVHCHSLAENKGLPKTFDFWSEYNHLMILNSRGITILQSDGWQHSKGIADEVGYATALGKPISHLKQEGVNYVFKTLRTAGIPHPLDSDSSNDVRPA